MTLFTPTVIAILIVGALLGVGFLGFFVLPGTEAPQALKDDVQPPPVTEFVQPPSSTGDLVAPTGSVSQNEPPVVTPPLGSKPLPSPADGNPPPSATSLPPIAPIESAPNREIYNISTAGNGPKITEAYVDGFSAVLGQPQSMGIRVQFDKPVNSVTVTMRGDTGSKEYELKLAEGTKTDGRWTGSWTVEHPHQTVYQVAIVAKASAPIESTVTLTFK